MISHKGATSNHMSGKTTSLMNLFSQVLGKNPFSSNSGLWNIYFKLRLEKRSEIVSILFCYLPYLSSAGRARGGKSERWKVAK